MVNGLVEVELEDVVVGLGGVESETGGETEERITSEILRYAQDDTCHFWGAEI
jgi:hypothetical protein